MTEFGWIRPSVNHDIDLLFYVLPGLPLLIWLDHIERRDHVTGVVGKANRLGDQYLFVLAVLLMPQFGHRHGDGRGSGRGMDHGVRGLRLRMRGFAGEQHDCDRGQDGNSGNSLQDTPPENERTYFYCWGDGLKIRQIRQSY